MQVYLSIIFKKNFSGSCLFSFSEVQVLVLTLYNSKKEIFLLFIVLGISSLFCGSIMFYMELLGSLAAGTDDTLISNIPIGMFSTLHYI